MSVNIEAYISGILDAKGTQAGGVYMTDGSYTFLLKKLEAEKSSKNSKVFLKAELYVVAAEPVVVPFDLRKQNEPDPKPNPVGSDVFRAFDIGDVAGQNDAKKFFCALLNVSVEHANANRDWMAQAIRAAIQPSNPYRGRPLQCVTYRTITKQGKNAGQPFIGQNWSSIACSDAEGAAFRAELDKPATLPAALGK